MRSRQPVEEPGSSSFFLRCWLALSVRWFLLVAVWVSAECVRLWIGLCSWLVGAGLRFLFENCVLRFGVWVVLAVLQVLLFVVDRSLLWLPAHLIHVLVVRFILIGSYLFHHPLVVS